MTAGPRRARRPAAFVVRAGVVGALAFAACGDSNNGRAPGDVTAVVSEQIATVVTVTWKTDVLTTGYVEFGPTPAFGFRTSVEKVAALEPHRDAARPDGRHAPTTSAPSRRREAARLRQRHQTFAPAACRWASPA